ncbi:hypothetical protein GKR26_13985, partial [Staphylococcus aureus]|nr:hypothetical protein [Staphylococcus aureus]
NIRKIVARRAVYYQIHLKKADFYQIINRNQLFTLPKNLMSQPLFTLPKNLMSQPLLLYLLELYISFINLLI